MKKDTPPPLRRSATWVGKFYEGSDACPPRERADLEGDDIAIMVDVRAPESPPRRGVNSRWQVQKIILCGSKKGYQQDCYG